ncbi:MAG TPA: L-aspartate oxidase [Candidatus Fermentibacter daniensis]|nr:L-aspartate oxidase [Candidatus Fermentibacter daniensis]HOR06712.1 L-aspartate oxidase [Candidatus Fermentibacter daniensis]HPK50941.1 L-aspartate oxidase [Candidatus Fermentibacter daniensis]HQE55866.1 L-aspartate oxidase [Candidatus Fermentibacter daniensis]
MNRRCDVLVIGGGLAGMACALELPSSMKVILMSKIELPTGSTSLAQGGIAAPVGSDDSTELHLQDTIKAGGGMVDINAAREIISRGPDLIRKLAGWGIQLEGAGGGTGSMEGGHSRRRILHYLDRTGRWISEGLIGACRSRENIEIMEGAFAINLITASREELSLASGHGDRCLGAYVLVDGEVHTVLASETVIATGGAGKVYRYTSNDDWATGDGIAMAWRAGLTVRNMEFYQFHPTCLYHKDRRNFLITEALRGEGAMLLNLDGERFMERFDPVRMELAPRDVVARAIDSEMKRLGHDHVVLDARALGRKALEERFPEVTEGVMSVGICPWEEPIPVVPAAHYCVGGVVAGIDGSTSMKGLRVIGEAASTGLHGANRLGSNSLLEAGVMGIEAARSTTGSIDPLPAGLSVRDWYFGRARPLSESVLIDHDWAAVRSTMWDYVGIIRTDRRLTRALRILDVISREVEEDYWSLLPQMDLLELRNLCDVAGIIVRSAILRRESRGLHYNLDCPETVPPGRDTLMTRN